jgi:hypothetical protein
MKLRISVLLALCSVVMSCSRPPKDAAVGSASTPTSPAAAQSSSAKTFDENVPPTRKEVIRALLSLQDVSLSSDSSCSNVGTNPKDSNIGDYISGFLAEQNDKGKNWLDIQTKRASGAPEPAWECGVVIRHVDGDDRWGWGVSFQMRGKDHSVVKGSIRCTGSG